ncbi:MAG: hypothetical protein PHG24_01325 [Candidatus Pacebacteria bacterium]|nr:hypothetical protein [Candidatus Paceibacterota bacterium]
MTTIFSSIESARGYLFYLLQFNCLKIEEDSDLKVFGLAEEGLLDSDLVPEEEKEEIRKLIDSQKGFKATDTDGREIHFVIRPLCENEFDCWFVDKKTGRADRI